ncbi:hypothetical protein [Methylotetracoccus oryzae]|nr:hypothetical protein [Methylotetracoccus oryzae]
MIALPITAALLTYSWALVHTLHVYRCSSSQRSRLARQRIERLLRSR